MDSDNKKISQLTQVTSLNDSDAFIVTIDIPSAPKSRGVLTSSVKATLKTYFDTLYAVLLASTASNDFQVGNGSGGWVKKTLAETITILRTSLDSVFAPIAKGVTNGDSHDHSGGDGAQIAYSGLSGLPTIINPPTTTAENDFQVGNNSGSWIKKTLAETITILRTSLDSIYAVVGHDQSITLAHGSPTLTPTAGTNIAATTATTIAPYIRVGNTVSMSGRFTADPTAAGACTINLSIPVASNFATAFQAYGVANGSFGDVATITSDATNDNLLISWTCTNTTNQSFYFHVQYVVV